MSDTNYNSVYFKEISYFWRAVMDFDFSVKHFIEV